MSIANVPQDYKSQKHFFVSSIQGMVCNDNIVITDCPVTLR